MSSLRRVIAEPLKIDKLHCIKIKNPYSLKDTTKELKRQVPAKEEMFADHVTEMTCAQIIFEVLKFNNETDGSTNKQVGPGVT